MWRPACSRAYGCRHVAHTGVCPRRATTTPRQRRAARQLEQHFFDAPVRRVWGGRRRRSPAQLQPEAGCPLRIMAGHHPPEPDRQRRWRSRRFTKTANTHQIANLVSRRRASRSTAPDLVQSSRNIPCAGKGKPCTRRHKAASRHRSRKASQSADVALPRSGVAMCHLGCNPAHRCQQVAHSAFGPLWVRAIGFSGSVASRVEAAHR